MNKITVQGIYSGNGRTTTIRLDDGRAINTRQVSDAVKRLQLIGGDYIKLSGCGQQQVTIYDRNGNYAGEIS